MFQTSCVHNQKDYISHAALYGMFFMHLCKQSACRMYNIVFLMMNTRCLKHVEDKKNWI